MFLTAEPSFISPALPPPFFCLRQSHSSPVWHGTDCKSQTLNLWLPFCLSLPSGRIAGVSHPIWLQTCPEKLGLQVFPTIPCLTCHFGILTFFLSMSVIVNEQQEAIALVLFFLWCLHFLFSVHGLLSVFLFYLLFHFMFYIWTTNVFLWVGFWCPRCSWEWNFPKHTRGPGEQLVFGFVYLLQLK